MDVIVGDSLPADPLDLIEDYLSHFSAYSADCLKIRTKAARIEPFVPNFAQDYVNRKLAEQRRAEGRIRALLLKARQLGMSTLVAGRFFRRSHFISNQRAVILADKKDRSGMLHGIYLRFYQHLPPELKPRKKAEQRSKHLIFESPLDCEIIVETAGDSQAGRGSTIQMLHASELAFWPNPEDSWVAVMQAVPDDDSEVIVESTANGVGGLFYDLWEGATTGENDFIPIFLPWWIHPEYSSDITEEERHDIMFSSDPYEMGALNDGFEWDGGTHVLIPEQLAWRRRTIRNKLRGDERAFRQEYPSTSREAFLVTGGGYFDEDRLRSYEKSTRKPLTRGDLVDHRGVIRVQTQERGPLRVWEYPSRLGRYVIFADVAQGKLAAGERGTFTDPEGERGGRDFSAAYVFDMETRRYVAVHHSRIAPEVFARRLDALGYFYSSPGSVDAGNVREPAYLGVESQGSGETVLRILKDELRYPNLFYQRQVNRRTNQITAQLGFHTNVETRPILLDDFAAAIRQENVAIFDADLIRECFTFVKAQDGKPQAMDGCHDDRVISAAGCLQMARYAPAPASSKVWEEEILTSPTGLFEY